MNRQTNQISHNSSTQLFYSQYLKQQQVSPTADRFSDEVHELKKKCDSLIKQLEFKEQIIAEMRAYQKLLLTKITEQKQHPRESIFEKLGQLEFQYQEKEAQFQKQLLENSQLVQENAKLQGEVEKLQQHTRDPAIPKFVNSIIDLVIQCHPQDHFQGPKPQLKECWRWLKRILNDYIRLKQEQQQKH